MFIPLVAIGVFVARLPLSGPVTELTRAIGDVCRPRDLMTSDSRPDRWCLC